MNYKGAITIYKKELNVTFRIDSKIKDILDCKLKNDKVNFSEFIRSKITAYIKYEVEDMKFLLNIKSVDLSYSILSEIDSTLANMLANKLEYNFWDDDKIHINFQEDSIKYTSFATMSMIDPSQQIMFYDLYDPDIEIPWSFFLLRDEKFNYLNFFNKIIQNK